MTDDSFRDFIRSAIGTVEPVKPSRNLVDRARVEERVRLRRIRRRAALMSAAAIVVISGSLVFGSLSQRGASADIPGPGGNIPVSHNDPGMAGHYGPVRTFYDYNNPYANGLTAGPVLDTFNNLPGYGSEINFATASASKPTSFFDPLNVVPGEQVVVRVYIDNDSIAAKGSLGTARGVRIRFDFSAGVANGFDVVGHIGGSNVLSIWDGVALRNNAESFRLSYVLGSAKEYTFQNQGGVSLPDSVVASSGPGVLLQDGGTLKPGWRNAVCVLITLQVGPG
jgi:hypothetical protein